jgi:hypothetical protein
MDKGRPGVNFELKAEFAGGRSHLPCVTLGRAANIGYMQSYRCAHWLEPRQFDLPTSIRCPKPLNECRH